jgi:putative alpha-1,2-mannosidase
MRGKDENGNFRDECFDPYAWGRDYTEGSAWQNSFGVYHDIKGLDELFSGKLEEKIDELMVAPTVYRVGSYGETIHEMSEMVAGNYGQCAISNQPSFHIPYLYGYLGETEKCAKIVKSMCDLFTPTPDGFPGDEDNGSMGAWYVFSCLGIYPICPGKREYVHIPPLFDEIKINGKKFSV